MPSAPSLPPTCPPLRVLERLAVGQESAEEAPAREHLGACAACREAVAAIRADNEFLSTFMGPLEDGAAPAPQDGAPPPPKDLIPGYVIEHEIHRGGQGIVYKAVQTSTRRPVAIKILLQRAFPSERQLHRFKREAEIIGSLDHPGIVTVYDGGELPGGRYGFAMEFIDGVTLDRWAGAARPERRGALVVQLRLFGAVCDAVSYAHRRGVIHRDLKPANIMVDAQGSPIVLDFGIAKVPELQGAHATVAGEFAGTLAYASPEQVTGDPLAIDTRSDVYALGVILYELLTGRHPYPVHGAFLEVARHVAETVPTRPSALSPLVDDELGTIVLRALEKDKERRYGSAGALHADVLHYLAGQPIDAKRTSTFYVLRKMAARHRGPVLAGAGALAGVVAVAVGMTVQAGRLAQQKESLAAALAESDVERARAIAGSSFPEAERVLWSRVLADGVGDLAGEGRMFTASPRELRPYWALWEIYRRSPCVRTVRLPGPALGNWGREVQSDGTLRLVLGDGSVFEASVEGALRPLGRDPRVPEGIAPGHGAALFPDVYLDLTESGLRLYRGGVLAVSSDRWRRPDVVWGFPGATAERWVGLRLANGEAVILDAATLAERRRFRPLLGGAEGGGAVSFFGSTPDGRLLAFDESPGVTAIADAWTGTVLHRVDHGVRVNGRIETPSKFGFAPDGRTLLVGFGGGAVCAVDIQTGAEIWRVAVPVSDAPWSLPTAESGVVVSWNVVVPTLWLSDTSSPPAGRLLAAWSGHIERASVWAIDPQGRFICSGSTDGALKFWPGRVDFDTADVLPRGSPTVHRCLYWPDGSSVVASGSGGLLGQWDVGKGRRLWTPEPDPAAGGDGALWPGLAAIPGTGSIVAASFQGVVSVYTPPATRPDAQRLVEGHQLWSVAASRDGRWIAGGTRCGMFRWDRSTGAGGAEGEGVETWDIANFERVPRCVFLADGVTLAGGGTSGRIHFWNMATGARRSEPGHAGPVRAVALTPDGRLVTTGDDRTIAIWDREGREVLGRFTGPGEDMFAIGVHPEGQLAVVGERRGRIWIVDLRTGGLLANLPQATDIFDVSFSPCGRFLLYSTEGGVIRTLDLQAAARCIRGNREYQAGLMQAGDQP